MAIQEETGPVLVTVFCDDCETTVTRDYIVPAGTDSLTVARRVMATQDGWMISARDDICAECFTLLEKNDPEAAAAIRATERTWDS
ncbi:hypothetical protein [Arthrobacter sp. A2-55]|uniref:hypothetical protein n=1 Tax=Arthrobacter sp. A2-55 TaxID=2897337 RepID=UPI0021CD2258|nr:hypothetical protein [Arthrobacter sp. A2-55]MCU6480518.1 hypothetical protein [Arthrobacter sp. A2-55]